MDHFVSIKDISKDLIESTVFELLDICKNEATIKDYYHENAYSLRSKILATLFVSDSLRTRAGFVSSFLRLGGSHLSFDMYEKLIEKNMSNEPLSDITGYISQYVDLIAIRCDSKSYFDDLIQGSSVPVISAGHGQKSHPTTAINYLSSIYKNTKKLNDLNVLVVAVEPKRCVNSLVEGLKKWKGNKVEVRSPFYIDNYELFSCNELKKFDVIFFDEDIVDYERSSPYFKLSLDMYNNIKSSIHIIHAKPVINLFEHSLKNTLKTDLQKQSRNSSILKSLLYKRLVNIQ
ncbi:hypothetical protein Q8W40_22930 [Vibrio penaeicida]|uniref:hypothetical protein n=1 Tax=Vibrio penaeicida TaxID=104609 RepID=UPI002732C73A|nr:hypothetical protein [Vibrio penaeicida]MDP2575067.1 hypothetical protein [Vibrio penaeicida]